MNTTLRTTLPELGPSAGETEQLLLLSLCFVGYVSLAVYAGHVQSSLEPIITQWGQKSIESLFFTLVIVVCWHVMHFLNFVS